MIVLSKQTTLEKTLIAEHHPLSLNTFGSNVMETMQCHVDL